MNFSQNTGSEREKLERRFKSANQTLLLVSLLTFVNILLLIFEFDSTFLFSATVPYMVAVVGYLLEMESITLFCYGISFFLTGIYALCALLSKKHYAATVASLVFFCIDSAVLVFLFLEDFSFAIDIFFHILILVSLISGTIAGAKLKKLPPEEEAAESYYSDYNPEYIEPEESASLGIADSEAKHRVLLEADVEGHHICYRRVERTNELVIDGYVYDEYTKLVETEHELHAHIDGHDFAAGFDTTTSKSYISVDGNRIAEKLRLW